MAGCFFACASPAAGAPAWSIEELPIPSGSPLQAVDGAPLAFDRGPDGLVYAVFRGDGGAVESTAVVFDAGGTLQLEIDLDDDAWGISAAPDGSFWAIARAGLSSGQRTLVKYSSSGVELERTTISGVDEWLGSGMDVGPDGRVYVNRYPDISVYDDEGGWIEDIDVTGDVYEGHLFLGSMVQVNEAGDRIYATSPDGHGITVLDMDGDVVDEVAVAGATSYAYAASAVGDVLAVLYLDGSATVVRTYRISDGYGLLDTTTFSRSIEAYDDNGLALALVDEDSFVVGFGTGTVMRMPTDGDVGFAGSPFLRTAEGAIGVDSFTSLALDDDGLVWVARPFAGTVVAYDSSGSVSRVLDVPAAITGTVLPLAVSTGGGAIWASLVDITASPARFYLVRYDESGEYLDHFDNVPCVAGFDARADGSLLCGGDPGDGSYEIFVARPNGVVANYSSIDISAYSDQTATGLRAAPEGDDVYVQFVGGTGPDIVRFASDGSVVQEYGEAGDGVASQHLFAGAMFDVLPDGGVVAARRDGASDSEVHVYAADGSDVTEFASSMEDMASLNHAFGVQYDAERGGYWVATGPVGDFDDMANSVRFVRRLDLQPRWIRDGSGVRTATS